jgi:hypothetical protein
VPFVAHGAVSIGLPLPTHGGSHADVTALGVEQTHRSPMTMAGEDLLVLSHEYLGAVVRRRA